METRSGETTLDDRRVNLRQYTGDFSIVIQDSDSRKHRAELVDISRGGVRFRTSCDLVPGSTVLLYPPEGAGLSPCAVRVVRSFATRNEQKDGQEYGGQFPEGQDFTRHDWFLRLRLPSNSVPEASTGASSGQR
ncbi:MAG TPA: PilZ domain-containing protein [Chthonomonadales bacterium]|nr:PilZ domain-containing protein [Chthonomonadales bacterium]